MAWHLGSELGSRRRSGFTGEHVAGLLGNVLPCYNRMLNGRPETLQPTGAETECCFSRTLRCLVLILFNLVLYWHVPSHHSHVRHPYTK